MVCRREICRRQAVQDSGECDTAAMIGI
jgi:hypothetical protein